MDVSIENTSNLGRRLEVRVQDSEINEKIKEKMSQVAKNARIKGFRPGNIPQKVLNKRFGPSVRAEVVNELIRSSLTDAMEEKKLQPAGTPQIDEIEDENGKDLKYTAVFEVFPEIKLADLSEESIEKPTLDITDADVDKMLDKMKDQFAEWPEAERAVQNDDRVTVDFERLMKDEEKSETQKDATLTIGSEGMLPGLSEALIGKNKGDVAKTTIAYPETWDDKTVAGRECELTVTIHKICEKKPIDLPSLAEKMGVESKEESELRAKIKERMNDEAENQIKEQVKESVLELLIEKNKFELPSSLIDQEKQAVQREHQQRQQQQGQQVAPLEDSDVNEMAEKRVVLGLLINEVVQGKKIKVDGQKVRTQIEKIAESFGGQSADIINAYYSNQNLLNSIERMVLLDQAVDAILEEVKQTEKSVSFDELMNPTD